MTNRECETIEFKKTTSELKEGVISLASMLNKSGFGTVYFGVKNDGTVAGLTVGGHTTSDISRAIKEHLKPAVVPAIEVLTKDGKQIVSVKAEGEEGKGYLLARCADDLGRPSQQVCRRNAPKNF